MSRPGELLILKQDLVVDSGCYYLFGGFTKSDDFDGHVSFQLVDKQTVYTTESLHGDHDRTLLLGLFYPDTAEMSLSVSLEAVVKNQTKGDVWLDELFCIPFHHSPPLRIKSGLPKCGQSPTHILQSLTISTWEED